MPKKTPVPSAKVSAPKSAYPTMYRDFDASLASIDDMEGDISNMARDTSDLKIDTSSFQDTGVSSDDSSFDDLLTGRSDATSPLAQSRKGSLFREQSSNTPRGHLFHLKQTHAPVYLTYPASDDSMPSRVDNYGRVEYELATKEHAMVVIIPNSRGLSENNQKLADAYATRTGCVTAVLDIYFDDPLIETPADSSEDTSSFISRFKSMTVDLASSVKRTYWLQAHNVFGVFDEEQKRFHTTSNWVEVQRAIEELLESYSVQGAIVIGFSFGANACARIAVEGLQEEKLNVVKGVILVHPIYMPAEVTSMLKTPTYLIVGHEDAFYTKDDLTKFEKDMKARKDNLGFKFTQMKTKADTPHGFAIFGDYSPMKIGDLPSKTCEKIVRWVLEKI